MEVDPFDLEARRWGRTGDPLLRAGQASGTRINPVRLDDVPDWDRVSRTGGDDWGNAGHVRLPNGTRFDLPSTSAGFGRDRSATPPPLSRQTGMKVKGFLKIAAMRSLIRPNATPFRLIQEGQKLLKSECQLF
jgi:hypothetical protein